VSTVVIDASIAIKWLIEEDGTAEALALRRNSKLIAPDLLLAECANVLWKKVRRKELSADEAILGARLLQGAEIELLPTRSVVEAATRISIQLDHPAYDCIYVALALENDCRFVTADERLLGKIRHHRRAQLRRSVIGLRDAARAIE
jgi:predicted nucleic acid-binding protein